MERRLILIVLIFLNTVVLLGQLWPEGVPPFARSVNMIFLIGSLLYFIIRLANKNTNI